MSPVPVCLAVVFSRVKPRIFSLQCLFLPQTHRFCKTWTGCRWRSHSHFQAINSGQLTAMSLDSSEESGGNAPEGTRRRYGPAGRRARTQGANSKQLSTALRLINQSGSFGEFSEICRGPVIPDCESKLHMIRLTEWQQTKTSQRRWIAEILSFIYLDRLRSRDFSLILSLV